MFTQPHDFQNEISLSAARDWVTILKTHLKIIRSWQEGCCTCNDCIFMQLTIVYFWTDLRTELLWCLFIWKSVFCECLQWVMRKRGGGGWMGKNPSIIHPVLTWKLKSSNEMSSRNDCFHLTRKPLVTDTASPPPIWISLWCESTYFLFQTLVNDSWKCHHKKKIC